MGSLYDVKRGLGEVKKCRVTKLSNVR